MNFIRLICFCKIFGGLHIFFTADSCKITEAKRDAHLHDGLQWKFASARAALAANVVESFLRLDESAIPYFSAGFGMMRPENKKFLVFP